MNFADSHPTDPAPDTAPLPGTNAAFHGRRAASLLAASLLCALALLTAVRWLGGASPGSHGEEIVQIPVPADAASVTPAKELTAPDPGDTP